MENTAPYRASNSGISTDLGNYLDTDFVVDDLLDWINAYPNFVFSYEPNNTSWRTDPATWQDQQFQQAFLTKILQNRDYLAMTVIER